MPPDATILHLEDSDLDAELVHGRLTAAGLSVRVERVTDRPGYEALLAADPPDLILSDYQVPGFDGLDALRLARARLPEVPFVFVSGALGEEAAIDSLREGATDYVLKHRLNRLAPAVGRALAEARERNARRRAEERAAAMLNGLTDGFAVLDASLRFGYLNAAFEQLTGTSHGDVLGQTLEAVYPPDLAALIGYECRQVLGTGGATEFECHERVRDVWLAVKVYPDPAGSGVCVLVADVTDRHRTNVELRASEERFRTLARAFPQMVWTTRADGSGVWVNRRWEDYFGCVPAGLDWAAVVHPDERCEVEKRWHRAMATGTPFETEFRLRRRDGEYRWHLGRAEPVALPGKQVLLWCGTCTDLHDRRLAEDALRSADRRKDEFLATLAHELRNPLAPIRTGLQLLKLAPPGGDTAVRARDMMDRQLTHMVRLVDDLLDVARVSRGAVELRPERVSIRSILESAVEACTPLIRSAGHELVIRMADDPMLVTADPTRLAQVVGNLLTNAAKYTPAGGRIGLAVERDGDEVVVSVTDNGSGIPPEMLDRIFEMFTQVGSAIERETGGLGIGLSLAKRLVELHGGTIRAESEGTGRGSTFVVRLPADDRAGGGGFNPTVRTEPAPLSGNGRRVLVVDDNSDGAESLALMLEHAGCQTATAQSGPEAFAVASRFRPQFVFLDIGLPGMDGYEVAKRLRATPHFKGIVIVALTGWGSEEDRLRSREAGFDLHLTKPAEPATVLGVLGELTTNNRAREFPPAE